MYTLKSVVLTKGCMLSQTAGAAFFITIVPYP
jgi:hypothetical protein